MFGTIGKYRLGDMQHGGGHGRRDSRRRGHAGLYRDAGDALLGGWRCARANRSRSRSGESHSVFEGARPSRSIPVRRRALHCIWRRHGPDDHDNLGRLCTAHTDANAEPDAIANADRHPTAHASADCYGTNTDRSQFAPLRAQRRSRRQQPTPTPSPRQPLNIAARLRVQTGETP